MTAINPVTSVFHISLEGQKDNFLLETKSRSIAVKDLLAQVIWKSNFNQNKLLD